MVIKDWWEHWLLLLWKLTSLGQGLVLCTHFYICVSHKETKPPSEVSRYSQKATSSQSMHYYYHSRISFLFLTVTILQQVPTQRLRHWADLAEIPESLVGPKLLITRSAKHGE